MWCLQKTKKWIRHAEWLVEIFQMTGFFLDSQWNPHWKEEFRRITKLEWNYGGDHGIMVIVVGNGYGNMCSNPGRDWLHFTLH